jgi:hypothetical protein
MNLPFLPQSTDLLCFSVVDNNAGTLKHSQLFKDPEIEKFLHSQRSEIKGLQDMDIFKILLKHIKPQEAHLLSSI